MSHYIIKLSYMYITSFITQQLRDIHDDTLVVNNFHQETADVSSDNDTNIAAVVRKNKIQRILLLLLLLSSHSLQLWRTNLRELWLKYMYMCRIKL